MNSEINIVITYINSGDIFQFSDDDGFFGICLLIAYFFCEIFFYDLQESLPLVKLSPDIYGEQIAHYW